jgi:uncharacterized protein YndB with AHSA1/START domain
MDTTSETPIAMATDPTKVDRASDCELVITRRFHAPARILFAAWTTPDLLKQWWTPKSFGITFISCEADVRPGGSYRFVFGHPAMDQPMAFFGKYLEVIPNSRLVWTNEEGGEDGAVTTLTFEEQGAETLVTTREVYPTKAALDEAIASGSTGGCVEQYVQLEAVLAAP